MVNRLIAPDCPLLRGLSSHPEARRTAPIDGYGRQRATTDRGCASVGTEVPVPAPHADSARRLLAAR